MLTTTPMEQNEIHFYPALPIELRPTNNRTMGLEPITRGFADQCNIAVCTSRAPCRTRTDNFLHGKEICYQLHQWDLS